MSSTITFKFNVAIFEKIIKWVVMQASYGPSEIFENIINENEGSLDTAIRKLAGVIYHNQDLYCLVDELNDEYKDESLKHYTSLNDCVVDLRNEIMTLFIQLSGFTNIEFLPWGEFHKFELKFFEFMHNN